MKNKLKTRLKNGQGITLLALAVTIVILIILAGVTIGFALNDNGIIKGAKTAKEQTEIDNETSIVKRASTVAMIKSKYGTIDEASLKSALDDETGEGKTEVSDSGDYFEVMFTDSNRYYQVDENGTVGEAQYIIEDEYAGDITKGGRCDGSEKKPYEISCIEDLVVFSNMSNKTGIKFENGVAVSVTSADTFEGKYIVLTKNLNFKSKYSYSDSSRTDFGNINGDDTDGNRLIVEMTTGTGFTPIGYNKTFYGNFDGKGNSIENIWEKAEGKAGLFSLIKNATVKNLGVTGNINSESYGGGIVSYATSSIIENCYNKINIIASDGSSTATGTGGIVGTIEQSTIRNCYNEGYIIGESLVGGIVGACRAGSNVTDCYNIGKVVSNSAQTYKGAGGIAGGIYGNTTIIDNCYNTGEIIGSEVGGIVGYEYAASESAVTIANVLNCYNEGVIGDSTAKHAGGIAGCVFSKSSGSSVYITIENSYNIGNIGIADCNYVGGILGQIGRTYDTDDTMICEASLKNCFNVGKLEGKTKGEIAGVSWRTVAESIIFERCYFSSESGVNSVGSGSVTGTDLESFTMDYMKSLEFVTKLNSNSNEMSHENQWRSWKQNKDGYPCFE